ncbi:phosphate ABC transporter substrate-binding/OmpA family protein [Jannaschia seohaensis]|uniref:Phosphate transport system substrate-binding protein n=1 Tax=Jannaschia seohaensis TaxID=475081 RepID=A0A2Y9B3C4_9RHOB|nr:phosphate ABC transporter substrate-binding/OmpA family protein [Jannaschia seohaensis]PWJ12505.1 phosphate transport system substrate-binding protein [Jannaschia seohaensis]SSA50986.1 phosphate transport system substrate-binding protein [Jannaschia seohaensis]
MQSIRSLTTTSALRGLVLAGALAAPGLAQAENVNLISADGTVDIVGEFVAFDENTYVIRTALGELRLSATRVRCEGAACPSLESGKAEADVILAGSDTLGQGVMPLLLEGFAGVLDADMAAVVDGTNLQAELVGDQGFGDALGSYLVSSSASDDAFTALLDKTASIGMAARRILPAEARALRDAGAGNMIDPQQEHIVAVDSIVVIVNPENGIEKLTMAQVGQIYSGQITNWSQVGGRDMPIKVVGRETDTGTAGIFYSAVMGQEQDSWQFVNGITIASDNNEAAALVNENPGAIGFVGYAFQRGAKPISLVNACGLTMSPDAFAARTEEYELQRRLYLYNREDVDPESKEFLDFVLSSDADALIRKAGFIDLGVASQEQPLDGDRARSLLDPNVDAYEGNVMREMLGTMIDYERLSTTFRFRTGSSRLDERGAIDMERLIKHLEKAPEGSKVMLVGFTDDVGAFDSNRELSETRAQQVLAELQTRAGDRLDGIELTYRGFGEVAPTACNAEDRGRAINRRVEVWMQAAR